MRVSRTGITIHIEVRETRTLAFSLNHTTLYTGVTSTIGARIRQHKEKFYPNSFSAKYNCGKLVYYKWFDTIIETIAEEKRIKGGSRKEKRNSHQQYESRME